MSRFLLLLGIIFFTNVCVVQAEVIRDFSAEYIVQDDASVKVVETITYDFESSNKHGIFRTLKKNHPQPSTEWYKARFVEIDNVSVSRNDRYEQFVLSNSRDELEIKIGDPDRTISGPHVYRITYVLTGALSYGDLGAEFYWNVTGNDWPVAIDAVRAVVRAETTNALSGSNACYQGGVGSTAACVNINKSQNSVTFTSPKLGIGQGLTIASELDISKIPFVTTERVSYLPFAFVLIMILLVYFAFKVYRFRTHSKVSLPVIAQYEPYENYLPMYTGMLFDGRLDPCDITAGIVYLAEQGFIKIKKTERKVLLIITTTDYEISLLRPVSETPTHFLQRLSGLLFNLSDLPPKTVMLSSLVKNRISNAKLIRLLGSDLKKDLIKNNFNVKDWPRFGWWMVSMPLIALGIFVLLNQLEEGLFLFIFTLIPVIVLVAILLTARRTKRGYETLNHLKGFKLFLSVTDKERFDFHNAPEKSPELFIKYLPYAIALGVEKKWAKVFEGITIPQPDWYQGGSVHAFSATELTSDIGAFSSSFSASSGTSGSSGGGSSGGGGGGGGGGSW